MKAGRWVASAVLVLSVMLSMTARAELVIGFDDGVTNPFSAGTITAAQSYSGDYSLLIAAGNQAVFNIPEPYLSHPGTITVTMRIFDTGRWINPDVPGRPDGERNGPRWGVNSGTGAAGTHVNLSIYHIGWMPSGVGYGVGTSDTRFANQWSQAWYRYGDPRQVDSLGDGGSNEWIPDDPEDPEGPGSWAGWQPSTEGEGRWTRWNFEMDPDGTTRIWRDGGLTHTTTVAAGGMTQIYLGGITTTGANRLGPFYVDDVTVIPEPATFGMLALGVLLLAASRKRRG